MFHYHLRVIWYIILISKIFVTYVSAENLQIFTILLEYPYPRKATGIMPNNFNKNDSIFIWTQTFVSNYDGRSSIIKFNI